MHEVKSVGYLTKGKIIFIHISTVLSYICHITGDISILFLQQPFSVRHPHSFQPGFLNQQEPLIQWEESRKEAREEGKGWSWIFHGCSAGLQGNDLQSAGSFKVAVGWQLGARKQSKGELHFFTWPYL